jgi:hypothetical protein
MVCVGLHPPRCSALVRAAFLCWKEVMLRWRLFVVFPALAAALVGCSVTRDITYDTMAIQRVHARPLPGSLYVATFVDARKTHAPSALLFGGDRETELGEQSVCANAETHYPRGQVAAQVTQLAAAHLERRGLFRGPVTTGARVRSDYVLTGLLRALYGVQETSSEAQVGAAFGLIGALASAGATSKAHIHIVLGDLRLLDANGRELSRLPDVAVDFQGELGADAYCWSIYEHTNEKLREALEQLAVTLEQTVLGARAKPAAVQPQLAQPLPAAPASSVVTAETVPASAPEQPVVQEPPIAPPPPAASPTPSSAPICMLDAECPAPQVCEYGQCADREPTPLEPETSP